MYGGPIEPIDLKPAPETTSLPPPPPTNPSLRQRIAVFFHRGKTASENPPASATENGTAPKHN